MQILSINLSVLEVMSLIFSWLLDVAFPPFQKDGVSPPTAPSIKSF